MPKIEDIEGIGPTYAKKLTKAGINTTDDLLKAGTTPKERATLAAKTGISEKLILEWVNLSDLFRIKGVGEEYSDLLEEAGVDTVAELATRNADNLHAKILEVNKEKKLVRRPPTLDEITDWIKQAKKLPRKVEY
jgi:predicted flap endonuclease-1-like 5' DNA nuclease